MLLRSNMTFLVTNEYKWLFTDLTWQFRDPFNLFKDLNDYERVK